MQELNRELIQHLEAGETVAVATIVRRKGSVPREVGAKMLVQRGGKISGTVGGGCGEADVWRAALNVIDTRRPNTVQVDLTEEIAMESQGVCGGIFDVFIQPWHAASGEEQPGMLAIAQTISHALESERAVALATIIAAGAEWRACIGQHMLVHENGETIGALSLPGPRAGLTTQLIQAAQTAIASGKPHVEHVGGPLSNETPAVTRQNEYHTDSAWAEIFVEPFVPPPVLLVAGAGHIAAPLAALAHLMNYSVSVTDDRASFANRERFPSAKQLLVGDIESTLRNYPITPRTHIVLVTRAHSHDVQGLRAIIDSPAAYIGMIGSQRRVWAVFKLLHDEGIAAEKLARVRAPIGLDLGGSTPEEIALCIMAEITMLHHGGTGQAMSETLRERFMERLRRMNNDG
ncbi:MAG TPA: XdhC family protein [Ktedonobacteraceae bacterium]|nr:XdhC family protein [Ktedonobacteraceae bacterium]